jgi:radical SAM superfamily enzyme YgiQ (UPF0313 family)
MSPKRVIEICRGIRKEKINIEWICEGRVDNCSQSMLREMVKAGCKVLYLGIESANQRILNYYNKKITPEQSKTAVITAKKAGLDVVVGSFIMGAPDETREEIYNTIDFSKRIPIDLPQFNILGAHPGNEIWNEFVAKGFLDPEKYWETAVAVCKIYPRAKLSYDEIMQIMHDAFFKHVYRPSFLVEQLTKTLKSSYRMNVLINNLSRISKIREAANIVA